MNVPGVGNIEPKELSSPHLVVLVSTATEQEAWTIAKASIERKLAACAQIFPIRSCYEWNGAVAEDSENLLLLKTHQAVYAQLQVCISELHSYEVPEIIALPITTGSDAYLKWVDETVVSQHS